jgi:hypothetical protein
MQTFAFISAYDERAVARFAASFNALKLRANLLTRRGGRPSVSRGRVNLKGGTKRPRESDDDGLHLNAAIVA